MKILHPLDEWFSQLSIVRHAHGEIRVLEPESWPEIGSERGLWDLTVKEVILVRCVLRIDAVEGRRLWREYCDGADEDDQDGELLLHAWTCGLDELLLGADTPVVDPEPVFSLRFAIGMHGIGGATGGWFGIRMTMNWVLVCDEGIEDHEGPLPVPIGLVSKDVPIGEGAAIVVRHGCRPFRDQSWTKEDFFQELSATGLDPVDAYRILLAESLRGDDELLLADKEIVSRFREEDMEIGLPEITEMLGRRKFWL